MPRYVRNSAILAKIEATYGVDAAPTGAANAMLVSNVNINPLNASNVDRDLVRTYLGGSEQLVGTSYVELSFDVEIQASGTAGTAPAWGALMRACAFAETITAGVSVEYDPITSAQESVTLYYFDDGLVHKLLGAKGSVSFNMGVGERPVMSFKFFGLDGGVAALANPALTLTGWKTPSVITDTNTADLLLGCAYAAGALTGGTAYTSKGLQLDIANDVKHVPLVGGEAIDITNRAGSGSFELDLTAAQEVTFMADVKANVSQSVGMVHGTAAGYKILAYAPAVQLINPKKADAEGRRLIGFDLRLLPSVGNDELKIVAL